MTIFNLRNLFRCNRLEASILMESPVLCQILDRWIIVWKFNLMRNFVYCGLWLIQISLTDKVFVLGWINWVNSFVHVRFLIQRVFNLINVESWFILFEIHGLICNFSLKHNILQVPQLSLAHAFWTGLAHDHLIKESCLVTNTLVARVIAPWKGDRSLVSAVHTIYRGSSWSLFQNGWAALEILGWSWNISGFSLRNSGWQSMLITYDATLRRF